MKKFFSNYTRRCILAYHHSKNQNAREKTCNQLIAFGEDDEVLGYSMTQFIETSLISGHFADKTNSAYIDIFSCKIYNPMKAAKFTQDYFQARSAKIGVILRD